MRRHPLGNLQLAAVLKIGCDAGRPEGVAADLGLDSGCESSSPNHSSDIGLDQGIGRQLARSPARRAKERAFPVFGDAGGSDVFLKVAVQVVMRGHFVFFSALLVKPHPAAPSLHKEVLYLHRSRRAYPGEGVDHEANQCSISQAGNGSGVDCVDQSPRFVGLEDRGLAAPLRVLRAAYGVGRVRRYDLADHHPIEEHPQSGQPQLYRGLGMELELRLDERRDVDRLYLSQIPDVVLGTEIGELPDSLPVGAAGVGVADIRAEEVPHPRPGFWPRRED